MVQYSDGNPAWAIAAFAIAGFAFLVWTITLYLRFATPQDYEAPVGGTAFMFGYVATKLLLIYSVAQYNTWFRSGAGSDLSAFLARADVWVQLSCGPALMVMTVTTVVVLRTTDVWTAISALTAGPVMVGVVALAILTAGMIIIGIGVMMLLGLAASASAVHGDY